MELRKITGKKGDIFEGIVFVVTLLFLAVGFLLMAFVFSSITHSLRGTALNSTYETNRGVDVMENFGANGLQKVFLFTVGMMIIAMMITSFLVPTHPVLFPVYIIIVGITLFIAVVGSNAYQLLNSGSLAAVYAQQTMIRVVMENLVRIVLVASALSLILMFARLSAGQQEGQL